MLMILVRHGVKVRPEIEASLLRRLAHEFPRARGELIRRSSKRLPGQGAHNGHAGPQAADEGVPLSDRGDHQTRELGRALKAMNVQVSSVVTSRSEHAMQTAGLLCDLLGVASAPVPMSALTPRSGPGSILDLVEEARVVVSEGGAIGLKPDDRLLVVGHEGRLSDLFTELTGVRAGPLTNGGAVCVRAATLEDLAAGRGEVWARYPTVDHQEDALRSKVNSKMTVSTFLAGFVFTALSAVLVLDHPQGWPWDKIAAVAALTASFALLVTAVYFFDQLGTPSGFWTDAERARWPWRWLNDRREYRLDQRWACEKKRAVVEGHPLIGHVADDDLKGRFADETPEIHRSTADGRTYWLMVHTSRLVFTPGVVLGGGGFLFLLKGTDDPWMFWLGLVSMIAASTYAAFHRPALGAD
jgi:phosphohistidine phosphatase SixA